MEPREPQLGIAVGKRGIGKTYETLGTIRDYVTGFGGTTAPKRVLILDVNDEFGDARNGAIKALALKDVAKFSMHPTVEARRIRPFNADMSKMSLDDIAHALFFILQHFRSGLLLIEDINKYLSHNFPMDVIGAICTNRHVDMDIIMHYQAIGKVPVTVWENANWIRFHKNNQAVSRHKTKFEERVEMFSIAEAMVNTEYNKGNKRFFVFCNLDHNKIYSNQMTGTMAVAAVEDYMTRNFRTVVASEVARVDLSGKKLHKDTAAASHHVKMRLISDYFFVKTAASKQAAPPQHATQVAPVPIPQVRTQ